MSDLPPRNEYPPQEEYPPREAYPPRTRDGYAPGDVPPRAGYTRTGYATSGNAPRRRAAAWYRVIALIWLITAVICVFIGARFILLLLAASTASPFVSFVYAVAGPLVAPFEGIFGSPAAAAHVFEVADLIAIAVYLLIAAGVVALLRIISGRRQPDVPYDAP